MIRIDGDTVRDARLALGLSQRSLAQATGVAPHTIVRIEGGITAHDTEVMLSHIQRLIDTLGVPLHQILADDTPAAPNADRAHAPDAAPDDMAALASVLLHTRANTLKTELADTLGWTLDRLRLAAAALDHHLRPLGMQVHSLRGGYLIQPLNGYEGGGSRSRIDRATTARIGSNKIDAALIHEALFGELQTQRVGIGQRPRLGRLLRDDVLTEDGLITKAGPALLDALDVADDTEHRT